MMDYTNSSEVDASKITEELPESTVEINVKTLDAQTYTLRVDKYVSLQVHQLSCYCTIVKPILECVHYLDHKYAFS